MRIYFNRVPNQTPFGIFTNLYPTRLNRVDRQTVGGWYLTIHVGLMRLSLCGATHV